MKSELILEKELLSGFLVVHMTGRLDITTSADFEKEYANSTEDKIVLDMANLIYISSSGIRVILKLARECKVKGGAVALCAPQSQVMEVFEIAGLDTCFQIHKTMEAALAS